VRSSGFTWIELLVVMFVMGLLLTIGWVRRWRPPRGTATQVTINIIDKAVDMYQKEHKRYPEMKEMAARLIGQSFITENGVAKEVDDGHPGPGYRLEPRGTVYGPWNGVDRLARSGDYVEGPDSARIHFLDAFGNPIWYCPFKKPSPASEPTYTDSEFDKDDSEDGHHITSIADYATDASGKFYRRDYIIMSQSANGKWGLIRGAGGSAVPTDDVTNFTKD
jgi:prepilin-type N-terminal cleavage/methylation domain-containing protein